MNNLKTLPEFISEKHIPKDFTGCCKFIIDLYKGATYNYKDGLLHSDNDEPAILHKNGNKFWYKNGKIHRENGYAIEYVSGQKHYVYDGHHCPNQKYFENYIKNIKLTKVNCIEHNKNNTTIKESENSFDNDIFNVTIDGNSYVFTRVEKSFWEQDGYKTEYLYILKDPFGSFWRGIATTYPNCEASIYELCRVEKREVVVTKIEVIWDRIL